MSSRGVGLTGLLIIAVVTLAAHAGAESFSVEAGGKIALVRTGAGAGEDLARFTS